MASVFSKIIAGELPAHKVAEDEKHLAFLDINPLKKGHALAIPKKEIDYIFDLTEQEYLDLQKFARKAGLAIEKNVECKRMGIAVLGLEVPHAHIHLIPIHNEGDLNFSNKRVKMNDDELAELAVSIKKDFDNLA